MPRAAFLMQRLLPRAKHRYRIESRPDMEWYVLTPTERARVLAASLSSRGQ